MTNRTRMMVGIRCDARPATGVGHLIRCVAVAEELVGRGFDVVFLGDIDADLQWAREQLTSRGLRITPGPASAEDLAATALGLGLQVIITDSYELEPGYTDTCRDAGLLVVSLVDGDLRGQVADIYVDQNFGAELDEPNLPTDSIRLAGARYALLRDVVRKRRPATPKTPNAVKSTPRVLCFFGGTDALGGAPLLVRLLTRTEMDFDATVVAARPSIHRELSSIDPKAGQSLTLIDPTDDLPELINAADLVVSATGSSTWELFCLGASTALVWVADNQRTSFERVIGHGLAAGLGSLADLRQGPGAAAAIETLRTLLADPDVRAQIACRAWHAVDGDGRTRVVDEIVKWRETHQSSGESGAA